MDRSGLDKEEKWFERGVKEAIWERIEKPFTQQERGPPFPALTCFGPDTETTSLSYVT